MGNPALATRHLTFLLQTMYNHLSMNEKKEYSLQLQAVSQQCEGAPVPLVSIFQLGNQKYTLQIRLFDVCTFI